MRYFFINILLFFFLIYFSKPAHSKAFYFNVTNNADSGPGSFRQAILDMNATPISDQDYATLNALKIGTIKLLSPLPVVNVPAYFTLINGFESIKFDGNGLPGPAIQSSSPTFQLVIGSDCISNFASAHFVVTNTNTKGPGSLSRALLYAAQTPAKDYIYFNIPGIAPLEIIGIDQTEFLPNSKSTDYTENYPIVIDGSTQPANGYTGDLPHISINKNTSFKLSGQGNEIYGINFKGPELEISASTNNTIIGSQQKPNVFMNSLIFVSGQNCTIQNNYIGTDPNNVNLGQGSINAKHSKNLTIANNTLSGNNNSFSYIDLTSDTNTVIKGNKIGTDNTGTTTLGNRQNGIHLYLSFNPQIGGSTSFDRNIFSGYTNGGIDAWTTTGGFIKGNMIGTDITGAQSLALPNSRALLLMGANKLLIGGSTSYEGNVMVSNYLENYSGNIHIFSSKNIQFYNNKIGVSSDDTKPLGVSMYNFYIDIDCDSISIGDINSGNTISNASKGVLIVSDLYQNISIRGNKFNNTYSGIRYNYPKIKPPVISELTTSGIAGTATPNANIDLYYSLPLQSLQGYTYIATVTSDPSGNWSYNGYITNRCLVTCTQTGTEGNTSEFTQSIGSSPENSSICEGTSIALQAWGGDVYQWSPSEGLSNASIANPIASPKSTTTYSVIISDKSGCNKTDSITIKVNNAPKVDLGKDTVICMHDTIELIGKSSDAIKSYLWSNGATSPLISVSPSKESLYILKAYNDFECSGSDTIKVSVNPYPIADAGPDQELCLGDRILLGTDSNEYSYAWSPSAELSDTTISSPEYEATESGTNVYLLTVTDKNNCKAKDTVTIRVNVCTGIPSSKLEQSTVSAYPNPFSDQITFTYELKQESLVEIDILNSMGTIIDKPLYATQPRGRYLINYTGKAPGVYFVRVNMGGKMFYQKVIKRE